MDYYGSTGAGFTAFIIIVAIIILVIGAIIMAEVAEKKGYAEEKGKVIAICIFLWVIGALYVVALPDKKAMTQRDQIIKLLESSGNNETTSTMKDENGNIRKVHTLNSFKDDNLPSFTSVKDDDLPSL